ncbi:MAG TPA: isoprenylcysteine carboxylmethyltransferase family protein [Leptospiraceae bacterium]|nr:isoprenylcysteine carboxylmethyltransferase family protein [Leptospiraceae bacterium]HMW04220.1 isoprenylcysteine carboxylmethyltransferase family protein [Leptospiraceae bacterium]HMX33658.1 isoprenylcysteine carboxylmethyltransferase family protein [Leptospiraceae bacterium]HMY30213.1 isoprenylcysteine carboxylmethyltransferase family protein [Leptospiraceae bacterium]HMZ66285.1 isoprenylcysteine carboxylmethyltransferase family protein [Leptospiraceae bacterium]
MFELNFGGFLFLSVWIVTIIFRLFELRLAKRNLAKRKADPNLKMAREPFFFLFVVLHSSFLVLVPLEIFYFKRVFEITQGLFCLFIYLGCLGMRISVLTTLKENWNVKVVYDINSKNSIATTGLYKFIRHPNYLIVILEIATISLLHGAFYSFVFFSLCNFSILYFRIKQEETALFQNPFYAEHFKNKKRFIPFIF